VIREAVGETANEEKRHCYDVSQANGIDACFAVCLLKGSQLPRLTAEEGGVRRLLIFSSVNPAH